MDRKESIEIMVNGVNPLFFGKGGAENARMVAEDMFDALAAARVGTEKP